MTTIRLPVLIALLAAGPLLAQELPTSRRFERCVAAVVESYPTDGTHAYHWPKGSGSGWAGNVRDLNYQGALFAAGDPGGRCYCCGLTFEVFFLAWQRWAEEEDVEFRIGDMDAAALERFRSRWFCAGDGRRGPLDALEEAGIGREIDARRARPGDFVQFWRHSGSGHSVVFLAWVVDRRGRPTGIRYWSTQRATRGIGIHEESFGGPGGVDPERLHIARVGLR